MSSPQDQSSSSDAQLDLQRVRHALKRVRAVPRLNLFSPTHVPGERSKLQAALTSALRPAHADIEALFAEHLPGLLVPNLAGCISNRGQIGTPLTNLLNCYDLCAHCCAEARRALEFLENCLLGVRPKQFLAEAVIAARVNAWSQAQASKLAYRERQASRAPPYRLRFSDDAARRPQFEPNACDCEIVEALRKSHPKRLTTGAIAQRIGRSESSIASNLKKLVDVDWLYNPHDRKGYGLTSNGLSRSAGSSPISLPVSKS